MNTQFRTPPKGTVGLDVIQGTNTRLASALRDVVLAKAAAAREDVCAFFEFVMRTEKEQKPVKITPHQRLMFEFIQAHDRAVLILPVEHSKSFALAAYTLWLVGRNPGLRGAVVCATQEQARKIVTMVRDYIEASAELRLVFPHLRPSTRDGDAWTQTAITVDRPRGIKDPTLMAVGLDGGRIIGSRLSWIVADDTLTPENTATEDARNKVRDFLDNACFSRLIYGPETKAIVSNSPWHTHDVVGQYDKAGWASLRMSVDGEILIKDDVQKETVAKQFGIPWRPFDSDLVRPSTDNPNDLTCRLVAHDPDPGNATPLWPEAFPPVRIEQLRQEKLPYVFNRLYRCVVRDDDTARCKQEYIDRCLLVARKLGVFTMVSEYRGTNPTFTGIDLAISPGEEHDDTAFFTFESRPDGTRVILDYERGQWAGPETMKKMFAKQKAYNSVVRVESNACLVPGTNVLTRERGYVPIEGVQVDEHVWTHKARWRPVIELVSGTSKFITHASIAAGLPLSATPNHWFYMREAGRTPGRKGGHHRPVGASQWVSVGFAQKPGYVALARPTWPAAKGVLRLPATRGSEARDVEVDKELALFLGLYMAEGHSTKRQVFLTLSHREAHIATFVEHVLRRLAPGRAVTTRRGQGTLRVVASSTSLARALAPIGKSAAKTLPVEWLGWPLELRQAVVQGWLVGDGCLRENNPKSAWPTQYFSGATISRTWAMWVRVTMFEAGFTPRLDVSRRLSAVIEGRTVTRRPIYMLAWSGADSAHLRALMDTELEESHWPKVKSWPVQRSPIVLDGGHAWARLKKGPGTWGLYEGPVHNLVVEEDESYTAEDVVVHNAQDFLRQFALEVDKSLPIKAHMTGRAKAHPEHGVEGFFLEMSNGAWAFPNDARGNAHPMIRRLIDACLYYTPSKHTDDGLMAVYMAREQARSWGSGPKRRGDDGLNGGSISANILAR